MRRQTLFMDIAALFTRGSFHIQNLLPFSQHYKSARLISYDK